MRLGVMQGRLTNTGGFHPQQFPWKNWQNEFLLSKELGLDCIEWMFNHDNWINNPLVNSQGQSEVLRLINRTGIRVESVCANYFMISGMLNDSNTDVVFALLNGMKTIDCKYLTLPVFDKCEGDFNNDESLLFFKCLTEQCAEYGIRLLVESNKDIGELLELFNNIPNVGMCYDLGNSAGLGRDIKQELVICADYIHDVHIKDKKYKGDSVMLGEGNVDFDSCRCFFEGYDGLVIMESYFGNDAVSDTKKNIDFIKENII